MRKAAREGRMNDSSIIYSSRRDINKYNTAAANSSGNYE